MSFAMDAYFEARLAFIDRPDARISTHDMDEDTWGGGVQVRVVEKLNGERMGGRYLVRESGRMGRWLAEKMRAQWGHEIDRREPSEPYDLEVLRAHLRGFLPDILPLRINNAWGKDERMHLLEDEVVMSPTAYYAAWKASGFVRP